MGKILEKLHTREPKYLQPEVQATLITVDKEYIRLTSQLVCHWAEEQIVGNCLDKTLICIE